MIQLKMRQNEEFDRIVPPVIKKIQQENIVSRIWNLDHTVWKEDPKEISNRLGWLRIYEEMLDQVNAVTAFVDEVRHDGYTHTVLLGMGGSSLAADVFQRVFETTEGYLHLSVLDSTDPEAVLHCLHTHDLSRTLFIVATKSGGTAETLAFFKFFYGELQKDKGDTHIGKHFIAITDPGSKLALMAEKLNFRHIFVNNPNIGGRFSVLSYFGLVPAALMGVDIHTLLGRAQQMATRCREEKAINENPAALLGATLGAFALQDINKVTFQSSNEVEPFGDWVEQLIAESTGKEGRGILPVVSEPLGKPGVYSRDRIFIFQILGDDTICEETVDELHHAQFPMIRLYLDDLYDFGALFFLWELATAIAGYCLKIQPFDQPNVEMAKHLARLSIEHYMETGTINKGEFTKCSVESLNDFLADVQPGDYIALQAYIAPTPEHDQQLTTLQVLLRDHFHVPVTRGYGPRFLHSTGQLHKGDAGKGRFIQLVSENEIDVSIPDVPGEPMSSMTFGILKHAQALGDYQALKDAGRRVIRCRYSSPHIQKLLDGFH